MYNIDDMAYITFNGVESEGNSDIQNVDIEKFISINVNEEKFNLFSHQHFINNPFNNNLHTLHIYEIEN